MRRRHLTDRATRSLPTTQVHVQGTNLSGARDVTLALWSVSRDERLKSWLTPSHAQPREQAWRHVGQS